MNIYRQRVIDLLNSFEPVSLEEMNSVSLMNRVDSKYLTDTLVLSGILVDAHERGYRVFTQKGVRLHGYDSIYYDTPDLGMFTDHRRGKVNRQKIRTRRYAETGQCFLEVKRKNNHGRTKKERMVLEEGQFGDFRGDRKAVEWLSEKTDYDADSLSLSLETEFNRITLVNKALTERITIDVDVRFHNFRTGSDSALAQAVIIELKQDGRLHSEMREILLRHRVKPVRVSKYCMGVVLTDSPVLPGRFKEKVRIIERINKNLYIKCYKPIILQPF